MKRTTHRKADAAKKLSAERRATKELASANRKIRRLLKAIAKAISFGAFLPADSVDVLNTLTKEEARFVHGLTKQFRRAVEEYRPNGSERGYDRE